MKLYRFKQLLYHAKKRANVKPLRAQIYVEQKFKPLLLQSITVDAKQSLDKSTTHPLTFFAYLHFVQKERVAVSTFYRERQKVGSLFRPFD